MISAIYICHWPEIDAAYSLCELLVYRNYHNDVCDAHWLVARFSKMYKDLPKHERAPFLYDDGTTYTTYWGPHDIFLLAVSRSNINAMLTISLLQHMHLIMGQFFAQQRSQMQETTDATTKSSSFGISKSLISGNTSQTSASTQASTASKSTPIEPVFTRESVLDNNALIYELLDECVDFGVVQITDYNILKEYIKMQINMGGLNMGSADLGSDSSDSNSDLELKRHKDSQKSKKNKASRPKLQNIKSTRNQAVHAGIEDKSADKLINSSIVRTQVLAVSWRLKGIFYSKNEIYIDIIETCDFAYDLESSTIKSNQILGVCMVRSYLSGMPICKLGLNEERLSQVEYDGESESEIEQNQLRVEDLEEEATNAEADEASAHESDADERDHNKSHEIGTGNEGCEVSDDKSCQESSQTLATMNRDINSETTLTLPKITAKPKKVKKKQKVPLTNVQFHLCVELSTIYKNNLIRFTPPDDKFQLFSFRVEQQRRKQMSPLILIDPKYRIVKDQNRLQIMCTITTTFKKKLHCRKLVVRIPIHSAMFPLDNADKDSFRFRCELGEVRYRVDTSEVLWAIADLPGSKKTVRMMAEVNLGSVEHSLRTIPKYFKGAFGVHVPSESREEQKMKRSLETQDLEQNDESSEQDISEMNPSRAQNSPSPSPSDEKIPPPGNNQSTNDSDEAIRELDKFYNVNGASSSLFSRLQHQAQDEQFNDVSLDFEIPMFAYSGLRVTYIHVDEETMKYTCFPWVRYLTQAKSEPDVDSSSSQGRYRFRLGPSNFSVI